MGRGGRGGGGRGVGVRLYVSHRSTGRAPDDPGEGQEHPGREAQEVARRGQRGIRAGEPHEQGDPGADDERAGKGGSAADAVDQLAATWAGRV